jgi:RNA polymerase sigma-70 factor (ECF subfamily)
MTHPDASTASGKDLRASLGLWMENADEDAARALIEGLHPIVIRIVHNHLPRGMHAEDLAQEVFLQFFKTINRYDKTRPLENWISRISVNVCLNALRTRKRRPEWRYSDLSDSEQAAVESLMNQPTQALSKESDSVALLHRLLEHLSPEDRIIIQMLHIEEKSIAEIVSITGWNSTLIKVRAFRARRKLRAELTALGVSNSNSEQ